MDIPSGSKITNLVKIKFGCLTVIEYRGKLGEGKKPLPIWLCACDCGKECVVPGTSLKSGNTTSCGCMKGKFTHRMSNSREHNAWCNMKGRCYSKGTKRYKDYGGRGISVCERWLNSFENFFADMGPMPEGMSLDRIDNNGPYSPENCRWATRKEQQRNSRRNVRLTFNGITLGVTEWSERPEIQNLGITFAVLQSRVFRGWDHGRALTTRVVKNE